MGFCYLREQQHHQRCVHQGSPLCWYLAIVFAPVNSSYDEMPLGHFVYRDSFGMRLGGPWDRALGNTMTLAT